MSQADLAAAIGTTQPQISRWLDAGIPPQKTGYLRRMAQALSRPGRIVTMEYLVDDSMDVIPPTLELTPDEYSVLTNYRVLRKLGFSVHEVIEWMFTMKGGHSAPGRIPVSDIGTASSGREKKAATEIVSPQQGEGKPPLPPVQGKARKPGKKGRSA